MDNHRSAHLFCPQGTVLFVRSLCAFTRLFNGADKKNRPRRLAVLPTAFVQSSFSPRSIHVRRSRIFHVCRKANISRAERISRSPLGEYFTRRRRIFCPQGTVLFERDVLCQATSADAKATASPAVRLGVPLQRQHCCLCLTLHAKRTVPAGSPSFQRLLCNQAFSRVSE